MVPVMNMTLMENKSMTNSVTSGSIEGTEADTVKNLLYDIAMQCHLNEDSTTRTTFSLVTTTDKTAKFVFDITLVSVEFEDDAV